MKSLRKPISATTHEATLFAARVRGPRSNFRAPRSAEPPRCPQCEARHRECNSPPWLASAHGAADDEPGVYELIVPRRPYKVYYRIKGEEVWIVHIRDA